MRTALASLIIVLALVVLSSAQTQEAPQNRSDAAAQRVVRLRPAEFKQLPGNLIRELERRNCSIPQEAGSKTRTNVIQGEFQKPGQEDWAVLCSVKGFSSILVFWNGSETSPAEIARAEDRIYSQDVANQEVGFSRIITAVRRDYIMRHYRAYGGPAPPPIDHQGIDDGFMEKGSAIYYYHKGKWHQLVGAD